MTTPADQAERILEQITEALTTDQALKLAATYAQLAQADATLALSDALTSHGEAITKYTSFQKISAQPIKTTPMEPEEFVRTIREGVHNQFIFASDEDQQPRRLHPMDVLPLVDSIKAGNRITVTTEELEWVRSYLTPQERIRLTQEHTSKGEHSAWLAPSTSPAPATKHDHQGEQPQEDHTEAQAHYEAHSLTIPALDYAEPTQAPPAARVTWDQQKVADGLRETREALEAQKEPNTSGKARVKNDQSPESPANGAEQAPQPPAEHIYPRPPAKAMTRAEAHAAVTSMLNGHPSYVSTQAQANMVKQALPQGMQLGPYTRESGFIRLTIKGVASAFTLASLEQELGLPPGLIRDPDDQSSTDEEIQP